MKTTFILLFCLLLSSCSGNYEDKIIGHWMHKQEKQDFMLIEIHESSNLLFIKFIDSKEKSKEFVLEPIGSKFQFQNLGGKNVEFTYLHETDKLLILGNKLSRVKFQE